MQEREGSREEERNGDEVGEESDYEEVERNVWPWLVFDGGSFTGGTYLTGRRYIRVNDDKSAVVAVDSNNIAGHLSKAKQASRPSSAVFLPLTGGVDGVAIFMLFVCL